MVLFRLELMLCLIVIQLIFDRYLMISVLLMHLISNRHHDNYQFRRLDNDLPAGCQAMIRLLWNWYPTCHSCGYSSAMNECGDNQ